MDSGVVPYIEEGFASAEFVEASVAPFQKPCHFFLSDLQSVVL